MHVHCSQHPTPSASYGLPLSKPNLSLFLTRGRSLSLSPFLSLPPLSLPPSLLSSTPPSPVPLLILRLHAHAMHRVTT
jgi:hypothetical protein